jgi:hypothetical protein
MKYVHFEEEKNPYCPKGISLQREKCSHHEPGEQGDT